MNDGVKILIERMQTHPEEFIGGAGFAYSKWGVLISEYKEHLDVEDRTALTDALCKLHQQAFTEKVLEELVDPKKSVKDLWGKTAISLDGTTPSPSIPSITMTPSLRETLNTLEEIKKQYEPKQSKTLFGKLFNYQ